MLVIGHRESQCRAGWHKETHCCSWEWAEEQKAQELYQLTSRTSQVSAWGTFCFSLVEHRKVLISLTGSLQAFALCYGTIIWGYGRYLKISQPAGSSPTLLLLSCYGFSPIIFSPLLIKNTMNSFATDQYGEQCKIIIDIYDIVTNMSECAI